MGKRKRSWVCCAYGSVLLALIVLLSSVPAAELKILLPLGRTAYQTNEWIDVSVVRQAAEPLAAGPLNLNLSGEDGSTAAFTFSLPVVPVNGSDARSTEHLHVNGWLLRPGHYKIEAVADKAVATAEIDVYSHIRKSSFRLINWGRARGVDQLVEGEDSLGFNLFYGHYGNDDEANFIRAGLDYMSCCTMSGGHQMDLRPECDWSDPNVVRGGTRRVVHRALVDRTRPNVLGVHFYDEPGLTWAKDPVTGESTPHSVPTQHRSYKSAFGKDSIPYHKVRADNPEDAARWRHWALWKLGFMDAAWKDAQFGVSWVRPDFLSVTQSQYGWSAFADGYYFNVARSLPVTSGHGGYDDYGCGYFNPSYFLEMARARDLVKPCWYLPTWYGNTPSERFRLEQYLSFITNIQGMICPPDIDPFQPGSRPAAEGVVESNKLMGRLGTIFTTMPVTRPPVAMLYSMSQNLHAETRDMQANYAHANKQGLRLPLTYLAGKMLQQQFMPVVEEDIVDGTLAAHHRAVVLTSVDALDAKAVVALETFAASGGMVMLTGDCEAKPQGAVNLGVVPDLPDAALVNKLRAEGKHAEANKYSTVGHLLAGAAPLAKAIKARLDQAGIKPLLFCDQPGITVSRQVSGDFEYLFAVNATYGAEEGGMNSIRAAAANLGFENDGRPVYDAVVGGPLAELATKDKLSGNFHFGPGQMRVFARTSRPIGRVQTLRPIVTGDFTKAQSPRTLELSAVIVDDRGRALYGSAPLEIRVIDPLGKVRYDLYRATDAGALKLSLPLAVNDPPGPWKVVVRELLSNTEDGTVFDCAVPSQCGAMAGRTERAVMFGNEPDNVFRFFRVHHDITIVTGTGDYNAPAAARLTESLRPWGVRCRVVSAAEVNGPRPISEEEARTWVGLDFGRGKPGKDNPVGQAGFDVQGPVVLIGTPEDNPLMKFIRDKRFLPYQPDAATFPGRNRGMVAWQRNAVGAGQESITLIAYDAEGMSEAVGSCYEAAAGVEPLMRFEPPEANRIEPAKTATGCKELPVLWRTRLPDRAVAIKAEGDAMEVLTWDGSWTRLDAGGRIAAQQIVPPGEMAKVAKASQSPPDAAAMEVARKHAAVGRIVKHAAPHKGLVAVSYWGGTLRLLRENGDVCSSQMLPQDITGLAWIGEKLVVGLADGQVFALASP